MEKIFRHISDQELIRLIKSGNEKYFRILVDRYEGYIFEKSLSYLINTEQAKDISQDILIKVYLQLHLFNEKAKFSTWLYAVIHNSCIDYLRRNKKYRNEVISEKLANELGDLSDIDEEIPENVTTEIMNKLLEEMSPEGRLILLLKYKEKHSLKDIQVALHLSESAVKMRLKRSREKIQELYNTYKITSKKSMIKNAD